MPLDVKDAGRLWDMLDAAVAAASERMTRNLDRIQKGTMMIGVGLAALAVPAAFIASTADFV